MIRIARIEVGALLFLFLVIGIVVGCFWQGKATPDYTPQFPTTPCVTEDSRDCYWDATQNINGEQVFK